MASAQAEQDLLWMSREQRREKPAGLEQRGAEEWRLTGRDSRL